MQFDSFVLATSTDDLTVEPDARDLADAIEFRMDLAEEPLSQLASYAGELPILVTNRVEWEGGNAADTADRLELLAAALEYEYVEAVDLELRALADPSAATNDAIWVASRAADRDANVIASAHDFERTPSRAELVTLLEDACSLGDVGKVAVTAAGPGDVLRLLEVTWDHVQAGNTVATMAMGSAGRHSRAVCPLYGSRIGYAPIEPGAATAPGQYDLDTLRSLIADLGGPDSGYNETKKV